MQDRSISIGKSKGVPLRLDIGPRDIENDSAFAAISTGGKRPLPLTNIVEECRNVLIEIADELRLEQVLTLKM